MDNNECALKAEQKTKAENLTEADREGKQSGLILEPDTSVNIGPKVVASRDFPVPKSLNLLYVPPEVQLLVSFSLFRYLKSVLRKALQIFQDFILQMLRGKQRLLKLPPRLLKFLIIYNIAKRARLKLEKST